MATPLLRPLDLGGVLDTASGLYRNLFVALVTIAAATNAVPGIMSIYIDVSGAGIEHMGLFGAYLFLTFLFSAIAVAASTFVISGAYLGDRILARDALRRALGFTLPLVIITVLSMLVIFFGFVLLIIPGLIAMAGLALSNAVVVIEAPIGPTDAMGRSWSLTKGERMKVLATLIVAFLLLAIPAILVGVLSEIGGTFGLWPSWISSVLSIAFSVFVYPFLYVVVVVLYYDMRVRKEGFDLELMARATGSA